jgi:hypothetical protein
MCGAGWRHHRGWPFDHFEFPSPFFNMLHSYHTYLTFISICVEFLGCKYAFHLKRDHITNFFRRTKFSVLMLLHINLSCGQYLTDLTPAPSVTRYPYYMRSLLPINNIPASFLIFAAVWMMYPFSGDMKLHHILEEQMLINTKVTG